MLPSHLLDALRPPRMRPALWHALRGLDRRRDACRWHHDAVVWGDFQRSHRRWRGQWARSPELAEFGLDLIDPSNPEPMRVEGCIWLTEFPTLDVISRLARLATDRSEAIRVRNQAAWTLGFRQLQQSDDVVGWTNEAVAVADQALLTLWTSEDRDRLDELAPALRHVQAPNVLDAFADDVVAAAPAIEAFATPKLALSLLSQLDVLPAPDAPRIVRLIGQTLGADVVPALLAYATRAPLMASVEALFTSLALDARRAKPVVDAMLSTLTFDRVMRSRAQWHEANPGVLPTVRALAIARTTSVISPEDRTDRCREAARYFASIGRIEPFAEQYLYSLWQHVAFRSRDDEAIATCVEAAPATLESAPFLVAPYIDALARAGRTDRLRTAAQTHAATAHATWMLATHGHPFAALAMERVSTNRDPEAVAGGVVALFLAGRPDLSLLALKQPPRAANLEGEGVAEFPGPDERWRAEYTPDTCPALTTLVVGRGLEGLLASVRGAPDGADPDPFDLSLLLDRERELTSDLRGASVCVVGHFENHALVVRWIADQGARIVDGPFAKTDFFVAAPDADTSVIARLRGAGVRELFFQ